MKATTLKKAAILAGSFSFLAGSAFSQTAVSGAGGYTTYDIQPGFNLIGLTLHKPVETSAAVTATSGNILTVDQDLAELTTGSTYVLEFTSGSLAGTIQVVTAWQGMNLTTPDDLSATIDADLNANPPVAVNVQFRKAATIFDTFGGDADRDGEINNDEFEVVINKGTSATGDLILVTDGAGGFTTYWHTPDSQFGAGSWQKAGSSDVGDDPVIYTDGMYVQNRTQEPYDIVLTGMVKTQDTELGVMAGFAYFSSVYPVGSTLSTSGLADYIQKGTSSSGDVLIMADGTQFWHTEDSQFGAGSWQGSGPGVDPNNTADSAISSGFIIQRRAANPYNALYTPPGFYDSL